jgi:hypothetical protein
LEHARISRLPTRFSPTTSVGEVARVLTPHARCGQREQLGFVLTAYFWIGQFSACPSYETDDQRLSDSANTRLNRPSFGLVALVSLLGLLNDESQ